MNLINLSKLEIETSVSFLWPHYRCYMDYAGRNHDYFACFYILCPVKYTFSRATIHISCGSVGMWNNCRVN
jgi:hypothetical protein